MSDDNVVVVEMPWPPKEVHQNYRPPVPAMRYRAVSKYRKECERAASDQGVPSLVGEVRVEMSVEFVPKDNRARDVQNLIGACKALMDGLSDHVGVDDKLFRIRWPEELAPRAEKATVRIHIKLPPHMTIERGPTVGTPYHPLTDLS